MTGIRCYVGRLEDLDALFATVGRAGGSIDVLVANAGIGIVAPLGEITEEQFDAMFTTNVKGSLFTVAEGPAAALGGASIILPDRRRPRGPSRICPCTGRPRLRFVTWFAGSPRRRGASIPDHMLSPGGTRTQGLVDLISAEAGRLPRCVGSTRPLADLKRSPRGRLPRLGRVQLCHGSG